jgi:hypothetical protein
MSDDFFMEKKEKKKKASQYMEHINIYILS